MEEANRVGKRQTDQPKHRRQHTTLLHKDAKHLPTEERLRRAAEEWRATFDSITDLVSIQDKNYKLLRVNRAYADAFGAKPQDLIGKTCFEVVHGTKKPLADCPHKETLETGKAVTMEVQDPRSGAYLQISTSPIFSDTGEVIGSVHISKDITEHRRAEEESKKLTAQLLQAQKMEAIGRLAGGVAHDFNNLLTVIMGYSELLLSRLGRRSPIRRDIEEIKKAGERAASLTRQLLTFSRRQTIQPKVLNLNEVVSEMEKMLRRLIAEDTELVTIFERQPKNVTADPGQLEQVIMNLAVNAHDAMPRGGRLTIRTENTTLDSEVSRGIPRAQPGKFVRLSLEDTGTGMSKEVMEHLFEPFFTTKKGGTGLGLSVVYGIIKQHKGWINVYSEPGKGTVFKVYLPATTDEPSDESGGSVSPAGLHGGGQRILLVEDEAGIRNFVSRVLAENGYSVYEAANTREALAIFKKEKGQFDLLYSDVVLPDKTGLELANKLIATKPDLPVMMTSGYTDQKAHWPAIQRKGFRFLQKPVAVNDLLKAVKEALSKTG